MCSVWRALWWWVSVLRTGWQRGSSSPSLQTHKSLGSSLLETFNSSSGGELVPSHLVPFAIFQVRRDPWVGSVGPVCRRPLAHQHWWVQPEPSWNPRPGRDRASLELRRCASVQQVIPTQCQPLLLVKTSATADSDISSQDGSKWIVRDGDGWGRCRGAKGRVGAVVGKMGALGGWGLLALALLFGTATALNRANKKPDSNIRHGKSKFHILQNRPLGQLKSSLSPLAPICVSWPNLHKMTVLHPEPRLVSTFESISAQNTWLRGSKCGRDRLTGLRLAATISFQTPILSRGLTSPSVAAYNAQIWDHFQATFSPRSFILTATFHLHRCRLRELDFSCACKKAVKSSDGKMSVFSRRSLVKATFRSITSACQRCQEFGTQSVNQATLTLILWKLLLLRMWQKSRLSQSAAILRMNLRDI